mmetsp:Transcript_31736/g.74693  ORF Transcript_31736/g.74693 Transcript_31736/m.74693 type:complete len:339 (-) Transcript_31736:65-1081(-)
MTQSKKRAVPTVKDENLDRFAGSSDEEEEEPMAPPASAVSTLDDDHDADEENDTDDHDGGGDGDNFLPGDEFLSGRAETKKSGQNKHDDGNDSDSSSIEGEEIDAATKMANVMSKILGTKATNLDNKSAHSSSVVLAKTVTPLQKLQQKEKEQQKAIKEKRRSNRERNLTALHLPLSIATTNIIQPGAQLSVAKELEQERFHRRVATRGVVALFNAITQHQKINTPGSESNLSLKNKETSKLTKHGFLDKIKAAAKSKGSEELDGETRKRGKNVASNEGNNSSSWGALKDDYMLNSKKNWDEESSDEELFDESGILEEENGDVQGSTQRKKRRVSGKQ